MEILQNIKLSFKCPKQLNQLQPCNGDWYCDGCRKIVHDFRGMSEGQILEVFAKNSYKLCGMFEAGRVEVLPKQKKWVAWASAAMVFLGLTSCHRAGSNNTLIGDTVSVSALKHIKHHIDTDTVLAPHSASKLQKQR